MRMRTHTPGRVVSGRIFTVQFEVIHRAVDGFRWAITNKERHSSLLFCMSGVHKHFEFSKEEGARGLFSAATVPFAGALQSEVDWDVTDQLSDLYSYHLGFEEQRSGLDIFWRVEETIND